MKQKIKFDHYAPRINKTKLKKFQENIGLELPDDYKAFLLKHNGGSPDPPWFVWPEKKPDSIGEAYFCHVDQDFLGEVSENAPAYSIELAMFRYTVEMTNIVPKGFLYIGFAAGDEPILLCCTGRSKGAVYLKLFGESPRPDSSPRDDLYRVAKSFSDFMDSICDYERIDESIRNEFEMD